MLYLAIDQHRKQLTVNLRDEQGDIVLKRQVSTQWERVRKFFDGLLERSGPEGGFVTILEVCGFNHWLIAMLREYDCRDIVLVQPDTRSKKKTDRRDANSLGNLLWVNRSRLLAGQNVHGLRRVVMPCQEDDENRQLTAVRKRMGTVRTRTVNKVHHILLKHNLHQECPLKDIKGKKARRWLAELPLNEIDRMEMDLLLVQWELWDSQLATLEKKLEKRQAADKKAAIVATMPGAGAYSRPCLGVADRLDRTLSAAQQLGELLGPDARLPQLGRRHQPPGFDHQTRQLHGPFHSRTNGVARVASRRRDEGLV